MSLCAPWFVAWVEYHQDLHPHRDWPDPHTEAGLRYFEGWIEAFDRRGFVREELDAATRRLQADPPSHPNRHLKALIDQAAAARREWAAAEVGRPVDAPSAVQLEASLASANCPECDGTGWAKRRATWHSVSRPLILDFFCRCPHGRWREANDPGRRENPDDRNFDDLQAHPELWHPEWTFAAWSSRPSSQYIEPDSRLRYLAPGEPAPEPIAPADLVKQSSRRRGLGPLPAFVSETTSA